ncbi:MAG: non-heme iron oxygenase ferredoxin subunit [Acidimicrobiia bacterium]|nr:non-heme iron oxygenase ferredoxin subunit [Acidimicrobiia bacterium]MDH3397061.1 non-heme iron oxygenase ferredoxin subunit [Acidimicrobiia bacterium]
MPDWVRISTTASLPEGRGIRIEAGRHCIALFRLGDEVHAIGDRCSHAEASLSEGDVFGAEIECPRHGATFDLRTGRPLSLPATKPVPVYQTKTEDGDLYLLLDEREES